jgi:hypothetical protein
MKPIRKLDASYRGLSSRELETLLADLALPSHLAEIVLEGNPIGDAGAALLAGWGGLTWVEVLNLADTAIGPGGLAALLASPQRPQPVTLHLDENPLYDAGVRLLAGSPFVSRVRYLGLSCTGLGHPGVRALAESPYLAIVETLDLTQTELPDECWQLLRMRFPQVLGG